MRSEQFSSSNAFPTRCARSTGVAKSEKLLEKWAEKRFFGVRRDLFVRLWGLIQRSLTMWFFVGSEFESKKQIDSYPILSYHTDKRLCETINEKTGETNHVRRKLLAGSAGQG